MIVSLIDAVPVTLKLTITLSRTDAIIFKLSIVALFIKASFADKVPLIETSTADKLLTHKLSMQLATTRSFTDKLSTHKLSIQLTTTKSVTDKYPIIASAADKDPLT